MTEPRIEELLAAERARPGFTSKERDALWRGVEQALSTGAQGSDAGSRASDATEDAREADAPARLTGGSGAQAPLGSAASAKLMGLLALAAGSGVLVGAVGHARWGTPRTIVVEGPSMVATGASVVEPLAASTTASAPSASAPVHATATAAPPAPRAAPSAMAPPSTSSLQKDPRDEQLARQRTLLEMARTAIARRDAEAAISSLETHAKEFPKSQLAEEREALYVQALAAAKRIPEARARAAQFRRSFPESPLSPVLDEATR